MGVLSTYGELKAAITDYSARTQASVVANLPLFVMRAHTTLMRELTIPLLLATADVVVSAERVAVPADFRAVERLHLDQAYDRPLSPTSIENRLRAASESTAARPLLFAIEGGYFAFGPAPDATYAGKLLYRRSLPFFANDAATNDLLAKHPFTYLYGALAEWARFDKFDEEAASFEAMFRNELAEVEAAERRDAMSGGVLASRPTVQAI